jgi:serine/threonine protein kinase/tetratricopeptide (TPR) repeat protein
LQQRIETLVDEFVSRYEGDQRETLLEELKAVRDEILATGNDSGAATSGPSRVTSGSDGRQSSGDRPSLGDRHSSGDRMAAIDSGDTSAETDVSEGWIKPGMQIGPYVVEQRIGRGGMGEVYRGRDLRLGREVAIKVLVHEWANQRDHAERFDREARVVATLSHPGIVSLFDVGNHEGRPYAVMELLRGETLRDRLRRSAPLDPVEVRRIGLAAAEALEVAHRAGIIHRDLKPENLFLTEDGRVKLLDFGLSRLHHDPDATGDATVTGVIMGTIGYLSPEQAGGMPVAPAADLFSLGCVLHECFYGQRPFRGETINESLAATLNGVPRHDPQRREADPVLADLIDDCLQKSPAHRPADAAWLARALAGHDDSPSHQSSQLVASPAVIRSGGGDLVAQESHTTGIAISRGPGRPAIENFRVETDRRAFLRGGVAAAGLFASGGIIYGGWRWTTAPPSIRSVAVLPLTDSSPPGATVEGLETRLLGTGEQLAAAIADQLSRIPDLRVVPYLPLRDSIEAASQVVAPGGTPARISNSGNETITGVARQLGVDAVLVGSVNHDNDGFQTINVVLVEASRGYQLANYTTRVREESNLIDQENTARRVAERIGAELADYRSGSPRTNESYHCLVNGYARMDPESSGALRDAMKCFQNAIRQDEKFAEAFAGLSLTAMILASRAALEERTGLLATAREAIKSALRLDPTSGSARMAEAMLAWQIDWDFDAADDLFDALVPKMSGNWVAQYEYAFYLAARGDLQQALAHAERAVALDPTSSAFRINFARLKWFAGDWQTALADMRATAGTTTGERLEVVRGATLDLLEGVGRFDEAHALLLGTDETFTPDRYWAAREDSLEQSPYGPYDQELNQWILSVRRGDSLSDQALLTLKSHRPPRLPFLLTAHPSLIGYRRSKLFEEANCNFRFS